MPTGTHFIPALLLLAACGSGTIRPTGEPGAVAPAPSPASAPPVDTDPAPIPSPAPEAPTDPPAWSDSGWAQAETEVEIRRIGRWVSSGVKGARRLVIRDPDTWSRFWAELGAGVRPEVDFGRDLVIAVASGERTTGGHEIAIERVARSDGQLSITVLETSPGPECMTTAALTQPVDVVVVSAEGVKGWSFADRTAVSGC